MVGYKERTGGWMRSLGRDDDGGMGLVLWSEWAGLYVMMERVGKRGRDKKGFGWGEIR